MPQIDPRVIRVSVEVNGATKIYQSLNIRVTGTRYANSNKNDCEVRLTNVAKDTQDYILSATSPFNKNVTPKSIFVDAGRESYGVTRIYSGNITSSYPTQPPDISLVMKCSTSAFLQGSTVARNFGEISLKNLSKQVASDLGLTLNFQATDSTIYNYTHTGSAVEQVDKLGYLGNIDCYVDNDSLVVKNMNAPLGNTIRILNENSGMIGIPETTEQGIKVRFLLDNQTTLGGLLRIQSRIYPALNGDYVIYKLSFDIATRETPFYFIAEGKRL